MIVNIALLSVTDTRTLENDKSGSILVKKIEEAKHKLIERKICKDDKDDIVKIIKNWINQKNIDVVIHLISLDHKKSETIPHEVSNINILPTWNLLERFTNKGLIKFINFSSFLCGDISIS